VKPLILVVEDEPPIQKLLAYNLAAAGFEVAPAYDGEEAVVMLDERTPDLVLLDWMLPQPPASSSAAGCAAARPPPTCRSSCSPPAARSPTASGASTPAATTSSPSPSRRPS
jgi:CheY-like chemotaxis protein